MLSKILTVDAKHLHIVPTPDGRATVMYRNDTRHKVSSVLLTIALVSLIVVPQIPVQSSEAPDFRILIEQQRQAKAQREAELEKLRVAELTRRHDLEQTALANVLVQKYPTVSKNAFKKILEWADEASSIEKVPKTMILAIIAAESGFNPFLKSTGNAEGLMQVIPSWHKEKMQSIGGVENIVDPRSNILKGTQVYKEYLVQAGNSASRALQLYLGDPKSPAANVTYANKVMGIKKDIDERLEKSMKPDQVAMLTK